MVYICTCMCACRLWQMSLFTICCLPEILTFRSSKLNQQSYANNQPVYLVLFLQKLCCSRPGMQQSLPDDNKKQSDMHGVSHKIRTSQGQCDGIIHQQQFVPPFTCYVVKHSIFISLFGFGNFILFLVLILPLSLSIELVFRPLSFFLLLHGDFNVFARLS